MKALIASTTITLLTAGSAIAGPYAVVENNGGYVGSKFKSNYFHIGWEGSGYYAEVGPSLFSPDGGKILKPLRQVAPFPSQIS